MGMIERHITRMMYRTRTARAISRRGIASKTERSPMKRLKLFFGSVLNPKTSETYTFWESLVLTGVCRINETTCQVMQGLHVDQLISGLLAYSVGRATSKAVRD